MLLVDPSVIPPTASCAAADLGAGWTVRVIEQRTGRKRKQNEMPETSNAILKTIKHERLHALLLIVQCRLGSA